MCVGGGEAGLDKQEKEACIVMVVVMMMMELHSVASHLVGKCACHT